jgi:hypothetical protein
LEDILGRAKSLGIQFEDEEEREHLEQLSALQELLHDTGRERGELDILGEDTTLHDRLIGKIREEIKALTRGNR